MARIIVALIFLLLIISCSSEAPILVSEISTPTISIAQIVAQQEAYLGQTITVKGTVSGHLEPGSASGIWGETLTVTDSGAKLYLKTNGNWIRFGTGSQGNPPGNTPSEPAYGNNVIGTTTLIKEKTYRLTGIIETDQYNPGRVILNIVSAEPAN